MKIFKNKFVALFAIALGLMTACRNDTTDGSDASGGSVKPDEVNNFVWKAMNSWYYWQSQVPELGDTYFKSTQDYANFINGKTPNKLFYSLLLKNPADGFSWIEKNNEIIDAGQVAEIEKKSGLDYGLYPKGGDSNAYVALINYVVPNSSAAAAGLKRGDVITKVNGSEITTANMDVLNSDQFTVTRAATTLANVVNGYYQVTTTDRNESLTITKTDIDENPIAHYQRYDLAGKRIGYLAFTGFKIDYNDELNAQFAKMKTEGITDLILDLRYNGGGSLSTALGLAQMINGSFTGQDYIYSDFNSKHDSEDGFDKLSSTLPIYKITDGHPEQTGQQPVNSLTLPKVYILVSFQTASASELTVYCLKKYIDVTTIGYYTVGKFVGSQTLYDSPNNDYTSYDNRSKSHNWKLQPITFAYYNKTKDPHPTANLSGTTEPTITPDYRISPYLAFNNIKAFGETSDPELKKALSLITGLSSFRQGDILPVLNYDLKLKSPKSQLYGLVRDLPTKK